MARTQRGAFAGAQGKGARGRAAGKAAGASGKAAGAAGKAAGAAGKVAGAAAAAAPALQWDKRAMTRLLNAVRAESFGEVTLNPTQDEGYLGRLEARVRTADFRPTNAQLCLKLFEWFGTFGGSPEAFEKCEMSVLRSDAGKRHEGIWASQVQVAPAGGYAGGADDAQQKRVPRLSFQAAPASSPARPLGSAFRRDSAAAEPESRAKPRAVQPAAVGAEPKGKKRAAPASAGAADADDAADAAPDSGKGGAAGRLGKGKGKKRESGKDVADDEGEVQDESDEDDTPAGRRTRRRLLPEYPGPGAAATSGKAAAGERSARGAHDTPSPHKAASRAPTAEKLTKASSTDKGAQKGVAHSGSAQEGSSSRPQSSAARKSPGEAGSRTTAAAGPSSGSSAKGGAARRLAWAATSRNSAPVDPNAGVPGFLLRARTALREAGGAQAYARADTSGANTRVALADVLSACAPTSSASGSGRGGRGGGGGGGGGSASKKAGHKHAPPENARRVMAAAADVEEEGKAVMAWASTEVRRQLSCNRSGQALHGLEPQAEQVQQILEACLSRGSNGSALLLGPHGSGKSAVLTQVLDALALKYSFPGFLVVRLNGLIHTSDVLAVREIARQLYLLDDVNAEHEFAHELKQLSNSEHALNFLFDLVKKCRELAQPVFFILDEFHLFAAHPRQSLLYNLLDLTQSPRAQV